MLDLFMPLSVRPVAACPIPVARFPVNCRMPVGPTGATGAASCAAQVKLITNWSREKNHDALNTYAPPAYRWPMCRHRHGGQAQAR